MADAAPVGSIATPAPQTPSPSPTQGQGVAGKSTQPGQPKAAPQPAIAKVKAASAQEKAEGQPTGAIVDEVVKEEAPKDPKKLKFKAKINGQEEDVELSEEEIQRDYQKWKAGDKTLAEAAKINKQNELVLEWLQKDPLGLLRQMGHDVSRLAAEEVNRAVELELMNPDARRAHELEQRLAQTEAQQKWREEQEANRQNQYLSDQARNTIQTEVMTALKDTGALPPTPEAVARVAQVMLAAMEQGQEPSMPEVVKYVSDQTKKELNHYLNKMDGKGMYEWLGAENVKKIQAHALSLMKRPQQNNPKVLPDQANGTERPVKILTDRSWDSIIKNSVAR